MMKTTIKLAWNKAVEPALSKALLSLFVTVGLLFSINSAMGTQSPAGCGFNNLIVNIGTTNNFVTNGTVVFFEANIANPALNCGSPSASCDVTLDTNGLVFICPGLDGKPNGGTTTLLPPNLTLPGCPIGYGQTNFIIPCLISVTGPVLTAAARVTSPGAVVHKNPLQDDSAQLLKEISVTLILPCLQVGKQCLTATNIPGVGVVVTFSGSVSNCSPVNTNVPDQNVLLNVQVFDNQPAPNTPILTIPRLLAGAFTNFTASYTNTANVCGPFDDTLTVIATVNADTQYQITNTASSQCTITYAPAIRVTKFCPPGPIQPGTTLNFSGVVSNSGNVVLTNVMVFNDQPAPNVLLLGPITLGLGQATNFSGSYGVPADSCGPYTDTLTARGTSVCGISVTNSDTKSCLGTNTPAIVVSKACPANPVPPGGLMVISGIVSNAGNITLTNVTVTNVIAAIGQSHLVFGPTSLAPGQSAQFTDSYTVPLNSCGPYRDTVLARGADKCFGRIVTASDFKDCPGITTPRIAVIKHCPANPVPPGGIAIFSGTVSNAGNITLTNVVVVNNRPTNNTPVIGPITLLPGQATNFTGSEVVPLNCCTYFDTLLATGTSICTGSNVVASATATCPTITTPRMTLTKLCPPSPVPLGQSLIYSGIVSNSGNIALINVMVVDNKPTNNTPVLGPISLAPGEYAPFSGSYSVPINICDTNISDTAFAQANDVCTGSNVTASATAVCPIVPTPRLSLTKHCPPNPVAPGDLLIYTGVISNSGTITITNVFVVDDRPVPNTPVLGPVTLIPGQAIGFSGSYVAPYDCCGPCVDTVTARGNEICLGSNVVASATAACPRITTPRIAVTRDCPPAPVTVGDLVFFTGVVSNSGNATLTTVLVVDDQAGVVLDNIALAPGEAVPYMGMYIPTNCGPNSASAVTASASDVCTGVVVSNRFVTSCSVFCTTPEPLVLYGEAFSGGTFVFSFDTELNQTYKVQSADSLPSTNWLTITNVLGTGSTVTIPDVGTNSQRFYRVMIAQ